MLRAKVKFTPDNVKKYVVATRDKYTAELWYYASYDTEERAYDIAQELDDGIVLESEAE